MGNFIVGQPIPIRYYQGVSGTTIKARVIDESDGVFGAELTLTENAALLAAGLPGFYETTFTPDAVGHWKALIYYAGVKVGQVFYDVGGGLTLQEKADVNAEVVTAVAALALEATLTAIKGAGWAADDNLKNLDDEIDVIDGYHDVPTADVATNAQMRDGIGNKTDTSNYIVGATSSLMRYLKAVLMALNPLQVTPTADSTTVNTITDTELTGTAALYEGMMVVPLSGAMAGQGRVVDSFNEGTKTLTVIPDWPSAPGAVKYMLVPSIAKYLMEHGKGVEAIYDTVDSIPVVTRVADATTTDGTVQTLFTIGSPGGLVRVSEVDFDLTNMVAGDSVRIKFAKRMVALGNMITVVSETYIGPQDPTGIVFSEDELGSNLFGFILTIERLAGGDREYAWELFYEG